VKPFVHISVLWMNHSVGISMQIIPLVHCTIVVFLYLEIIDSCGRSMGIRYNLFKHITCNYIGSFCSRIRFLLNGIKVVI
jgi:hypothetical protein